jgi:hypothetical protein
VHAVESVASVGAGPQVSTALHESVNDPQPQACVAHVFCGEQVHECALGSHVPPSHAPQSMVTPQPLSPEPQAQPRAVHVWPVQPHWFMFPLPPHVCGATHVSGHCTTFPQPSSMLPHCAFIEVHVAGMHGPVPHWSVPPPPHVAPASHVPQLRVFPQPSGTLPHSALKSAHVSGWHLHWCTVRSHVSLAPVQSPQSTVRPHGSMPTPHAQPSCGHDGTAPQASLDASPAGPSSPAPVSLPLLPLLPPPSPLVEASAPPSPPDAEKD